LRPDEPAGGTARNPSMRPCRHKSASGRPARAPDFIRQGRPPARAFDGFLIAPCSVGRVFDSLPTKMSGHFLSEGIGVLSFPVFLFVTCHVISLVFSLVAVSLEPEPIMPRHIRDLKIGTDSSKARLLDTLLGKVSDSFAAARANVTLKAARDRRQALGWPPAARNWRTTYTHTDDHGTTFDLQNRCRAAGSRQAESA